MVTTVEVFAVNKTQFVGFVSKGLHYIMSLLTRKPVFGVSDQVSQKLARSAKEASTSDCKHNYRLPSFKYMYLKTNNKGAYQTSNFSTFLNL